MTEEATLFTVIKYNHIPRAEKLKVFLVWDDWNDYSFLTLFGCIYFDSNGEKHHLGGVKIGYYGQKESERRISIGDRFDEIADEFFSIGVDDDYYIKLNNLGSETRDKILNGLNDIAKNTHLIPKVKKEQVFKVSFLRGLSLRTIEGQYSRLAIGATRLTPYHFTFTSPEVGGSSIMVLEFNVVPDSNPPTNIHILIGRNGVGKTFMINNMIDSLTKPKSSQYGKFISTSDEDIESDTLFANLICITFSAFDEFEHPPEKRDKSRGIQYSYIGLKTIQTDGSASEVIEPSSIITQFYTSINNCKITSKTERWKEAIAMLETDPMFKAANIGDLIDYKNEEGMRAKVNRVFKKLSSGHKLILLTISRLVEKLEERSLVLIDEPESHLHPPLLSSFMRTLAHLLIDRNAVSIIATHSPVVLQEVPCECVWMLRRTGLAANAERPRIETFGENVGILTQEVFGLEVTDSGFHKILDNLVREFGSYDDAVDELNGKLGLEAKAILRGLFYDKENQND